MQRCIVYLVFSAKQLYFQAARVKIPDCIFRPYLGKTNYIMYKKRYCNDDSLPILTRNRGRFNDLHILNKYKTFWKDKKKNARSIIDQIIQCIIYVYCKTYIRLKNKIWRNALHHKVFAEKCKIRNRKPPKSEHEI